MKSSIKEITASHKNHCQYYDVTVTSYGGCATTTVLNFLHKNHYITNSLSNWDGIKHIGLLPDQVSRRCIYIFGDPLIGILSIYHRRQQNVSVVHQHFNISSASARAAIRWQQNVSVVRQHFDSLHIGLQKHTILPPAKNLETYAKRGKDSFLLEQQFDNWFNARPRLPILFLRYETLWDNLEILFDFVELPAAARKDFPKFQPRVSSIDTVAPDVLKKLNRIYGAFREKLNALPDYILREPDALAEHIISGDNRPVVQKNSNLHT